MDMFDKLSLAGLVPVIKVEDAADAVPLCQALKDGGLPVAEITFRTDAAEQAIRNVHEALPDVMLGAGTVLTIDQAKRAIAAGASYIVSPGLNPEVVRYCTGEGVPILPGCANPSDIEVALSLGLKTVKFFPAEALGGLKLIKAMSAPYGDVTFVPTGGINEQNFLDYLAFSKVKAVGGSWMVPGDAVKAGDWAKIEELTRSAVTRMLGFELRHIGVNSGSSEQALEDARAFEAMLGWPAKQGNSSSFSGVEIECMNSPKARGTHGHIAVYTNDVARAMWHMQRKGYTFDESTLTYKNGKPLVVYFDQEIAGFAIHLLQK